MRIRIPKIGFVGSPSGTISVADPDPGSGAFDPCIRDPGSTIHTDTYGTGTLYLYM
jgi:hypothetical protein